MFGRDDIMIKGGRIRRGDMAGLADTRMEGIRMVTGLVGMLLRRSSTFLDLIVVVEVQESAGTFIRLNNSFLLVEIAGWVSLYRISRDK